MSKLNYMEKLLDGAKVEWRPLGEVTILRRGRVMSKGYLVDNAGSYPVYSSQTANGGTIGKINTFDFNDEFISWTTDGANAGTVFYRTGKFSITNVCGLIKINDKMKLNYKFLFYWLSIEAQKHVYFGMGNPKLMNHQVEKILVPIPCPDNPEKSLAIQAGIVRILDTFTELNAELNAELSARKKQYRYYRDQLLAFAAPPSTPSDSAHHSSKGREFGAGRSRFLEKLLDGAKVEWKPLGEVFSLRNGYTPSKAKSGYWTSGDVPWFRMEDLRTNGGILSDAIQHVHESGVKGKLFPENSIIMSTTATIGEHALITVDYMSNQRFTNFTLKNGFDEILDIKFIYYYFFILCEKSKEISKYLKLSKCPDEWIEKMGNPYPMSR